MRLPRGLATPTPTNYLCIRLTLVSSLVRFLIVRLSYYDTRRPLRSVLFWTRLSPLVVHEDRNRAVVHQVIRSCPQRQAVGEPVFIGAHHHQIGTDLFRMIDDE